MLIFHKTLKKAMLTREKRDADKQEVRHLQSENPQKDTTEKEEPRATQ